MLAFYRPLNASSVSNVLYYIYDREKINHYIQEMRCNYGHDDSVCTMHGEFNSVV